VTAVPAALFNGVPADTALPVLRDPQDASALSAMIYEMIWTCPPGAVTAWSNRLDVLAGGGQFRGGRASILAQRLRVGAQQRRGVFKTITRTHAFHTPAGEIRLATDDQPGRAFIERLFADDQSHEPGVVAYLARSLGRESLFVDVGAHTGYFACIAGRAGATVIAIEMQSVLQTAIARNAALNDLDKIHVLQMAAGNRDGMIRTMRFNAGLGTRVMEGIGAFVDRASLLQHNIDLLPMMRLDTLFQGWTETPDVVKIDAEGFELCVLDGAEALIGSHRTAFIVEAHIGQMSDHPRQRDSFVDYFPLDRWRVRDLATAGAPEVSEAYLRSLTDPDRAQTGNPNLLFEPI
jgi:FkbM family methyltransferase